MRMDGLALAWRGPVFIVVIGVAMSLAPAPPSSAQSAPDPAQVGAFTAPFEEGGAATPLCARDGSGQVSCKPTAVGAIALQTGEVLYWDGVDGTADVEAAPVESADAERDSRVRVMDLRSGEATWAPVDNDASLLCAAPFQLADGRVVLAGGTDLRGEPDVPDVAGAYGVSEVHGLRGTRVYEPGRGFHRAGDMAYARWCPGTVTLPSGKVLVASGVEQVVKNSQLANVRRTETFDPATSTWSENYAGLDSETSLPLSPRLHVMPDGKVFYGGTGQGWSPGGLAADAALWSLRQVYDPDTKRWARKEPAQFGFRSGALETLLPLSPPYDRATVLVAGGTLSPAGGAAVPLSEEVTVTRSGTIEAKRTGDLTHARSSASAVLLPDGKVLAVNGSDIDGALLPGAEAGVLRTEIYDPRTQRWTPAASSSRIRAYRGIAMLLADGRVLVGGHSPVPIAYTGRRDLRPGGNSEEDPSFQVYSPPYLFRGERPTIDYAPAGVAWGSTVQVTTPDADSIESVVLVRVPSSTHGVDNDQRALYLPFTRRSNARLDVVVPPSPSVAPPGAYYLFVNRKTSSGPVPSVARVLRVSDAADPRAALQPYPADAPAPFGAGANPDFVTTQRLPGECPRCRP